MAGDDRDLGLERALARMRRRLAGTTDVPNALRFALRTARDWLGGGPVVIAVRESGERGFELFGAGGDEADPAWDHDRFAAFLAFERVRTPADTAHALVRRRLRPWAVLAARRPGGTFTRAEARGLSRLAEALSEILHDLDRERALDVRGRLDRKIMQRVAPKDLFYQVLDGLRTLTSYDHSSALLLGAPAGGRLEVVAEQIACVKARSPHIGRSLPVGRVALESLTGLPEGTVLGFDRTGDGWRPWPGGHAAAAAADLGTALAYHGGAGGPAAIPHEATVLVAPFEARAGWLGVIKLAGCACGRFGAWEADLLARFAPVAAVAIQNAHRLEQLAAQMVERENQLKIAHLARFVAHDVNHHLGVAQPTVQQLRHELAAGRIDSERWGRDLARLESALAGAHRLFRGMLRTAREPIDRGAFPADPRAAIESVLGLLEGSLHRAGVQVALELPATLPAVALHVADAESLLFNLVANARDAMPAGGHLTVAGRADDEGRVEVRVADTGCGIDPETRARMQEAFFTTKPQGTGLGLTICRSILWAADGSIAFEPNPGGGTVVRLGLPAAHVESTP